MRMMVKRTRVSGEMKIAYLYRAGHGAQGEKRGAVFDGRLAVKHPLCVHE